MPTTSSDDMNCLICQASITISSSAAVVDGNLRSFSTGHHHGSGEKSKMLCADSSRDEEIVLKRHLIVIFIVEKLFEVPGKTLEDYLKKYGNPDDWVRICEMCGAMVDKAWRSYQILLGTVREFGDLRNKIVDVVKKTRLEQINTDNGGKRRRKRKRRKAEKKFDAGTVTTELVQYVSEKSYESVTVTCPIITRDLNHPEKFLPLVTPKQEVLLDSPEEDEEYLNENFVNANDDINWQIKDEDKIDDNRQDYDVDGDPDYDDDAEDRDLDYDDAEDGDPDYDEENGTAEKQRATKKVGGIRCKFCNKCFSSENGLSIHMGRNHKKECKRPDKLICNVEGCGQTFTLVQNLKAHIKRHTRRQAEHKCDICGREFYEVASLRYHQEAHKRNTIPTSISGKSLVGRRRKVGSLEPKFTIKSNAEKDGDGEDISPTPKDVTLQKVTTKHLLKCKMCNQSFSCQRGLSSHMTRVHPKGKKKPDKYVCDICDKEFLWLQSWRAHQRRHQREDKFECDICGRKFYEENNFHYHQEAHKRNTIPTSLDGRKLLGRKRRIGLNIIPITNVKVSKTLQDNEIVSISNEAEESESMTSAAGNSAGNKILEFECTICKKLFASESALRIHTGWKHKDLETNGFVCTEEGCRASFEPFQRRGYRLHMARHKQKTKFRCSICDREFLLRGSFLYHKETHKRKSEKTFICHVNGCKKEYLTPQGFRVHLLWHKNPTPYSCEICGRKFFRKANYNYHLQAHARNTISSTFYGTHGQRGRGPDSDINPNVQTQKMDDDDDNSKIALEDELISSRDYGQLEENEAVTEEETEYKCQICGLLYGNQRGLMVHMGLKHKDSNPNRKNKIICSVNGCGREYSFHQRPAYRRHMMTHRNGRFRCTVCSKEFHTKHSFLYHKGAHKRGTIPSSLLPPTTTASSGHHLATETCTKLDSNNVVPQKTYICDLCGKGFATEKTLKFHQQFAKSHLTGDALERFKCKYCGKGFHTKGSVDFHEKTHHQYRDMTRPFQCELCGRGFFTVSKLRSHLNKHQNGTLPPSRRPKTKFTFTQEKDGTYLCKICGKSFTKRPNFGRHMRFVHEKNWATFCERCGKGLTCNQHLRVHMRRVHKIFEEGVQEYKCAVRGCNQLYYDKKKYDKHMAEVHCGSEDTAPPFTCVECGRGFWKQHKLRQHLQGHEKRKTNMLAAVDLEHQFVE